MNVFQVTLNARPTENHPSIRHFRFGALVVWIAADSTEDAAYRARAVAEELPYELSDDNAAVCQPKEADYRQDEFHAINCAKLDEARKIGLAMFLHVGGPGILE